MAFGKLTGPSVVDLIATQAELLISAAEALSSLVAADPDDREEFNVKLHAIENEADEATHTVLRKINSSFVLPYDREDLFALTSMIDDCVDLIDEAGDNIVLYRVNELPTKAFKLVDLIERCAHSTAKAMTHLDKVNAQMRSYWVEINQLENHGDTVYRSLISDLFNDESRTPLEAIKLKYVVDCFEASLDRFEDLAEIIETIAIKES